MPSCLKSNSIHYADETSLYQSNSIRNIQFTIKILETDIRNLNAWSKNNGLVFNNKLEGYYLHLKEELLTEVTELNGKSIRQKATAKLFSVSPVITVQLGTNRST